MTTLISKEEKPFRGRDMTGEVFGRLTVVGLSRIVRQKSNPKMRYALWTCRCQCGTEIESPIGALQTGNTSSCGCYHKEQAAKLNFKHGHKTRNHPIHPLYWRWQRMIGRCHNPNSRDYRWYGARGIQVCDRWRSFTNWLEDMGTSFLPGLTIERIDVDGNYEPGNVIWDTWEHQHQNKRNRA